MIILHKIPLEKTFWYIKINLAKNHSQQFISTIFFFFCTKTLWKCILSILFWNHILRQCFFYYFWTKIGLKFHLHSPYFQSHQFCIEKLRFLFLFLCWKIPKADLFVFFSPRGPINRSCTTVWYGWIYILLCLMYTIHTVYGFVRSFRL